MGGKIGVEEALQVSFMCYDQLIEIRDPENLWKKLKKKSTSGRKLRTKDGKMAKS